MAVSVTVERLTTLEDQQALLQQGRSRIESMHPHIPEIRIEPDMLQSLTTAIEQGRCAAWSCSTTGNHARSLLLAIPTALDPASSKAHFFPGRYAMHQFSCHNNNSISDIFPLYTEACRFLQEKHITVHRCSVYYNDIAAREIWSNLGYGNHHCHTSRHVNTVTVNLPTGITIRPAVDSDYPVVQMLFRQLVSLHNASPILQPEPKQTAVLQDYPYLVSDPDSSLLVAEHNKEIVGYLDGYISSSPEGYLTPLVKPPFAYVRSLYVAGRYRGRGIGSSLLQQFNRWCSGHTSHPDRIHVDYRTANIPAAAFWRANGFEPILIGMLRRLPKQRNRFFSRR